MFSLEDDWFESGSDLDEFKALISEVDRRTFVFPVNMNSIDLLTPIEINENTVRFATPLLNKSAGGYDVLCFNTEKAIKTGTPPRLIEEMKRKTKLMLKYNEAFYFASVGLTRDLGARAGLAGDGLYESTLERNTYFASRYKRTGCDATAVIRQDNYTSKVFGLASPQYAHVKQKILYEFLQQIEPELGPAECVRWRVDHNLTWLLVRFPEKAADIAATYGFSGIELPTPGLLLETSDTGCCSLTVSSVWYMPRGKDFVKAESHSRKHYGQVSPADFKSDVSSKVWATYTLLPERLCDLALISVSTPRDLIEKIFEHKIGRQTLYDIVGKRDAKGIIEAVCVEFNPTTSYTAYDIVMSLMLLPERIFDPGKNRQDELRKAVYRIPFLPIEKMMAKKTVVLSPV